MLHELSIIVPVYNAEKLILKLYENISKVDNSEIIFIDDGSSDNSFSILHEISLLDTKVKVLHQSNKGPMHARNYGLKHATKPYVIFVDIDDAIDTNFFKDRSYWMDFDILVFSYFSERQKKVISKFDNGEYSSHDFLYYLSCSGGWELWGKIFKKSLFNDILIPVERLKAGEDAFVFIQVVSKCEKILVSSKVFYNYFFYPNSISNRKDDLYIIDNIKSFSYIFNSILSKHEFIDKRIFSNLLILFFCNSLRKNFFSKTLLGFRDFSNLFYFLGSLKSGISLYKFFIFFIYYPLLSLKL